MSFNISLSGLNAAQKDLDVTSNNIANVATTGFKKSRAEFGDVYTNSVFSNSRTTVGSGVQTELVSQQFSQGSIESTDNSLDLAISGEGFFALTSGDSKDKIYSRAGNFQVDERGFVVNQNGYNLQVYPVNKDGTVSSQSLDSTTNLQIPTTAGKPTATENVTIALNLNASDEAPAGKFDPELSTTYNSSTSVVVYDSLGQSHTVTYYFSKDDDVSSGLTGKTAWDVKIMMEDVATGKQESVLDQNFKLIFDDNGQLINTGYVDDTGKLKTSDSMQVTSKKLGDFVGTGASGEQVIVFKFPQEGITQYSSSFAVNSLSQDGSTVGQLTGIDIDDSGLVNATYSNGTTNKLGKIALAKFSNPQGLTQIGDTCWKESVSSGEAVAGIPGVGTMGTIKNSSLESSNVDLSASLVDLISAQRNYQANSKALEAASNIMQTILNVS